MKTNPLLIIFVFLGALLLIGCGARDTPVPVVPEGARAGDLTGLEACEYQPGNAKVVYAAECGTLVVPENWDKVGSRFPRIQSTSLDCHANL